MSMCPAPASQPSPMPKRGDGALSDQSKTVPEAGAASADPSLTEQAVEAFGVVQRRVDRDVSPERLRGFLQVKTVTPDTILGLLADYGRARGLVMKPQSLSPSDVLKEAAPGDVVLMSDRSLGVVEEASPRALSKAAAGHDAGAGLLNPPQPPVREADQLAAPCLHQRHAERHRVRLHLQSATQVRHASTADDGVLPAPPHVR